MVICCLPIFGHCELDLVSRIIVSRVYLLFYLRQESHLGMVEKGIPFSVTFTMTLTSDLMSRFFASGHISYITNNFLQMCLILDQFLWWHLSHFCDISSVIMAFLGHTHFLKSCC